MSLLNRLIAISLLGFFCGCGSLNDVTSMVEQTDLDTLEFWAKLQGVQYRENKSVFQLNQANLAALKNMNFQNAGTGFSSLAAKHGHAARQLTSLKSENVDPIAVEYRDRLADAHEALADTRTTPRKE